MKRSAAGCACCASGAPGGATGWGGSGATGGRVGALGAAALLLAYSAGGALLFLALEGGAEGAGGAGGAAELRAAAVERLWLLTEDLNVLYRANWTRRAAAELAALQRDLLALDTAHRWTFATSFLYALTLITTIGDGCVPVSGLGRVCGAVYACGGVGVVLVYLSAVGGALGARLRTRPRPRLPPPGPRLSPFLAALNPAPPAPLPASRTPASVAALLVAAYVFLGALLFRATERWSLLDAAYFSFSTLATIGFGPLRPGRAARAVSPRAEDLAVAACCLYIVVGIAVVAVCFTLLQEELGAALRARGGDVVEAEGPPVAVQVTPASSPATVRS